jgi:hypothetical protein
VLQISNLTWYEFVAIFFFFCSFCCLANPVVSRFAVSFSRWTTDVQLREMLAPYGNVTRLRFMEDKANGKSKGIVMAVFENPAHSVDAFNDLTTTRANMYA